MASAQKKKKQRVVFAFDVESMGLYGTGFAVGAVVRDEETHADLDSLYAACSYRAARTPKTPMTDLEWVKRHVLPNLPSPTVNTPREVRDAFFNFYGKWKASDNLIVTYVANCGAPVETRFLADVARDNLEARSFSMPYPLHELGTVMYLCGKNPREAMERTPEERDEHNPLHDARQCARLWIEYAIPLFESLACSPDMEDPSEESEDSPVEVEEHME